MLNTVINYRYNKIIAYNNALTSNMKIMKPENKKNGLILYNLLKHISDNAVWLIRTCKVIDIKIKCYVIAYSTY